MSTKQQKKKNTGKWCIFQDKSRRWVSKVSIVRLGSKVEIYLDMKGKDC